MKKTIVPNDLRDFMSLAGIFSALGIFWKFFLQKDFFIDGDALFLILVGAGLLVTGKVFTIKKWARDGIQESEYLFLFSILLGFPAIILGVLVAIGMTLPQNVSSIAGFLALFIGAVTLFDYIKKNT